MEHHNLYIKPPVSEINITIRDTTPATVTKAKRADVPPMYRRSIVNDVIKGIGCVVLVLAIINFILFFATVL